MAAPTVTFYPVTSNNGSPQVGSAITTLAFGPTEAGFWSDVKAVIARFSGNGANTLKFWLMHTDATGGNSSVSQVQTQNHSAWKHNMLISSSFFDPTLSTYTAEERAAIKAGTANSPSNETFEEIPETEPPTSQFGEEYTVATGGDSKYIYLCSQPPNDAGDGMTTGWGFRLSFLYP